MANEVKIVEKVKFWEEQDKINELLIPRVLEMHDQLKSTSLLSQQNSSNYIQINSSFLQLKKELEEKNEELSKLFDINMQDIDTRYKGLIVSITELREEFLKKDNSEIIKSIQEQSKKQQGEIENILKKTDEISGKINQYKLLHTAISQEIERVKQSIEKQDRDLNSFISKELEKIKQSINQQEKERQSTFENFKKQIDRKNIDLKEEIIGLSKSLISKNSQEIQQIHNQIIDEINELKEIQYEQAKKFKMINIIAIILAILAIIISIGR